MGEEIDELLDDVLDNVSLAGEGYLLAVAAGYRPDDPAHLEAWADVERAANATDATAAVEHVRARVAAWATRGSQVTGGHLGADWAAEQVHAGRITVGRALVDYVVAQLLRDHLLPASFRALVAPWGLDTDAADDDADDDLETVLGRGAAEPR
jgi:hypothetical protein